MAAIPDPIRLDPAFAEPDRVWSCIRGGAPYRLQAEVDRSHDAELHPPWFRGYWTVPGHSFVPEAEPLLEEPALVDAARRCFAAEVVRPQTIMVNVAGPMEASPPHTDLPWFRGAPARTHPVPLLYAMMRSGLFDRWAIRVASALVWFHPGEGGAFEYWPEGPSGASQRERAPLWNVALVGDNDRMLHRVEATGPTGPRIPRGATLHPCGDDAWEVRTGAGSLCRYEREQVRISVLWKAHVFRDAEEAKIFDAASDDLDPSRIEARFVEDARRRGRGLPRSASPLEDAAWIDAVSALYP